MSLRKKTRTVFLLGMTLCPILTVVSAKEEEPSRLILNIPSNVDFPSERLNLTIQLPNKIEPTEEAKKLSRKVIKKKFDYESRPIKEISRKSRYNSIMANFARKGLLNSALDRRSSRYNRLTKIQAARILIRVYQAFLYLDERNELRTHNIVKEDILDMKELVDEFQRHLKMFTFNPTLMHQELDRIAIKVNKTSGKGTIRITGLQESDDGTTINLYLSKD